MQSLQKYTGPAIVLHWVIAVLVSANVALAWIWPHLADESVRPAIDTHKSIGITVLGLVLVRILWRATHKPPEMPGRSWAHSQFNAAVAHGSCFFAMRSAAHP